MTIVPLGLLLLACTDASDGKDTGPDGQVDTADSGETGDTADSGDTGDTADSGDSGTGDAELRLVVEADELDIGEGTAVDAAVYDGDTRLDTVVDLEVSPAGGAVADGTFSATADGVYTITATAGELVASSGPIYVDSNGPLLVLTSPVAASWVAAGTTAITGTATDTTHAVGGVTLDGAAAALDGTGGVSASATLALGANVLVLAGTDTDPHNGPNAADTRATVMAGPTADLADSLAHALEVRIGLDLLDDLAGDALAGVTSDAAESALLASNPLYSTSISCVDVDVDLVALSWGALHTSTVPSSAGVEVTLGVTDLVLDFRATVDLCGKASTYDGSVAADALDVVSDLAFDVPDPGDVDVTITDSEAVWTGLDVDWGGLDTLLAKYGLSTADLEDELQGVLGDQFADLVAIVLPPAVEAALESVVIDEDFDVVGTTEHLTSLVTGIATDADGLTCEMDATLTGEPADPEVPEAPGSLSVTGTSPAWADEAGGLAVQLDAIDRMLHLAWRAGALGQTVTGLEGSVDVGLLDPWFPGIETLDLAIAPQLPPVLVPGDDGLRMQAVALAITLSGRAHGVDQVFATGWLDVEGDAQLALASGGIDLTFENIEASVEIPATDAGDVARSEDLEAVLTLAASALGGDVLPTVHLGLPDVGGLDLLPDHVGTAGATGAWIEVSATP